MSKKNRKWADMPLAYRQRKNANKTRNRRIRAGIPVDPEAYAKYWQDKADATCYTYSNFTRQARDRGLEVTITSQQLRALRKGACVYCGSTLPKWGSGLDRIDNSKGYHIDNVVTCCASCNRVRSNVLTCEEMHVAMGAVLVFRRQK